MHIPFKCFTGQRQHGDARRRAFTWHVTRHFQRSLEHWKKKNIYGVWKHVNLLPQVQRGLKSSTVYKQLYNTEMPGWVLPAFSLGFLSSSFVASQRIVSSVYVTGSPSPPSPPPPPPPRLCVCLAALTCWSINTSRLHFPPSYLTSRSHLSSSSKSLWLSPWKKMCPQTLVLTVSPNKQDVKTYVNL